MLVLLDLNEASNAVYGQCIVCSLFLITCSVPQGSGFGSFILSLINDTQLYFLVKLSELDELSCCLASVMYAT